MEDGLFTPLLYAFSLLAAYRMYVPFRRTQTPVVVLNKRPNLERQVTWRISWRNWIKFCCSFRWLLPWEDRSRETLWFRASSMGSWWWSVGEALDTPNHCELYWRRRHYFAQYYTEDQYYTNDRFFEVTDNQCVRWRYSIVGQCLSKLRKQSGLLLSQKREPLSSDVRQIMLYHWVRSPILGTRV